MPDLSVDPLGPVLVCYRQSDAEHLAERVTSALRAVGAPAWFDRSDMGVGRFDQTFRRAGEAGFAGAVFVATAEVSEFIRRDEAPVWDAASTVDLVPALRQLLAVGAEALAPVPWMNVSDWGRHRAVPRAHPLNAWPSPVCHRWPGH